MTTESVVAIITATAGAVIALSNTHTIRSWMEQKGLVKKAAVEKEQAELKLKFQRFDEVMKESKEEIRLLKLKVEAVELNAANERTSWIAKTDSLNKEIVKLAQKAAAAEAEVKTLHSRQNENVVRIEHLEQVNAQLLQENEALKTELNKRGGR